MSLSLKISTTKNKFLPGESIPVEMVLANESGKTQVIPEFTYNSDLTELIIFDSGGQELARLNDYLMQEVLGFFPVEKITPPQDSLKLGQTRRVSRDVSRFRRLLTPGKYALQGSFKYYDKRALSEKIEIEIVPGQAKNLRHIWQYQSGSKAICHFAYCEQDQLMHMAGDKANPEAIYYNLPCSERLPSQDCALFTTAYDQEEGEFLLWLAGKTKNELWGCGLLKDQIKVRLETAACPGKLAETALVETRQRRLIIPEIRAENSQNFIIFHIYSAAGRKLGEQRLATGAEAMVFAAGAFNESDYLILYGFPVEGGFDLYAGMARAENLADLKAVKLWQSAQPPNAVVLPPGRGFPRQALAALFNPEGKLLRLYDISLDPKIGAMPRLKLDLVSQGDLQFHSLAIDNQGAVYMLFVEVGFKLLYFNCTDNIFQFITENKFSDPQLVATPEGIFLTYIDHEQVLRFKRMESRLKPH